MVDAELAALNTLSYTNTSFPSQITGVQDPFGRNTVLKYNSGGMLTNVVDVAGLSSSYVYDYQGWVTNLVTPYGTTTFINYTNSLDGVGTNEFGSSNIYMFIRAVRVIDADGGTNLYMLRQDSSEVLTTSGMTVTTNAFLPAYYPAAVMPTSLPAFLPANNLLDPHQL